MNMNGPPQMFPQQQQPQQPPHPNFNTMNMNGNMNGINGNMNGMNNLNMNMNMNMNVMPQHHVLDSNFMNNNWMFMKPPHLDMNNNHLHNNNGLNNNINNNNIEQPIDNILLKLLSPNGNGQLLHQHQQQQQQYMQQQEEQQKSNEFGLESLTLNDSIIDEDTEEKRENIKEEEEENEVEIEKVKKKIEKKRPFLPKPNEEKMKEITAHAYDIYEKSKCEENRGRGLLIRLQNLVSKTFPGTGVKLHLFGSSANGMSLKNGDIDICMIIGNSEPSDKIIEKLADMLTENGFTKILAIPTARVPIVKFKDPNTNLACDICINNKLALYNTRLVQDYSMIDERMRPLVYVVKRWAKRRKINEPAQGTLSSYAYINLVISFLQSRSPPILPCLQELSNGKQVIDGTELGDDMDDVMVDGFNCKYYNDMSKLIGFGSKNKESLGALVFHFFQTYAREFSFMNEVVSIRNGSPVQKTSKTWESIAKKSHYWLSVEDPFEITHNLARVVNRQNLSIIISELNRAYKLLSKSANLHKVCREYISED